MKPIFVVLFLLVGLGASAQNSRLHIPSEKPIKAKDLPMAWNNPEVFCLQLFFDDGDSTYRERDLDLLDSAYMIGFDRNNPRLYTISIEAFGPGYDAYGTAYSNDIMRARVESIYRYFTMRGREVMPVRYAYNPIHCSCHGDTTELVRFEVPTDRQVYDCDELPDSRKILQPNLRLENSVLITFRDNPMECLGGNSGCFLPAQDSNIRAYYTQVILKKGSIYSVQNTKDACPPPVQLTIDEHLDHQQIVDKYALVPHRRQIILPVGYIVLHSSFNRAPGECQYLSDSIYVRFPVTEEQIESGLKIFAKKYNDRGIAEFKSVPTKRVKGGAVLQIQGAINPTMFDTIYLAKRINEDEVTKYLYSANSTTEQGAVTIIYKGEERYFKPFKVNSKGEYDYKRPFKAMLRIVAEEEDDSNNQDKNAFRNDGDEELE